MPEPRGGELPARAQAGSIERRAFVRYESERDITCRSAGAMKDAGWIAKLLNISSGGIGLLLRHRFQPGSILSVELEDRRATLRRTVFVKVVHATAVMDDVPCWLLGCTFRQELSDEELQELL